MTESSGAALRLEDLAKHYGTTRALDGVTLNVDAGEFLTLLGPSGSGKTTTLELVGGFVHPTRGRIMVDGADIAAIPAHRRNIGVVFQDYALFPHLTVWENVAFPLRRRRLSRSEVDQAGERALGIVNMQGYENRRPAELSGGQKQRVAVARAISFKPRLLLMDEPLGALDRRLRESLQIGIRELHRELDVTILYVTHDQEEALVLSDRIALFRDGEIEQVGTPEELYRRPVNRFVASFLGDNTVLPGTVSEVNGRTVRMAYADGHILASGAIPEGSGECEAGQEVALSIRPERLRVLRAQDAGGTNHLPGVVERVTFLGGTQRLEVSVEGGVAAVSSSPDPEAVSVREGESVFVCWRPEDAVLLTE